MISRADIEKYILDNFAKFSNLPQSIFIELYRRTFKFIADRFMVRSTNNYDAPRVYSNVLLRAG
jgi:ABC-type uncharacterized transport system permease subunit